MIDNRQSRHREKDVVIAAILPQFDEEDSTIIELKIARDVPHATPAKHPLRRKLTPTDVDRLEFSEDLVAVLIQAGDEISRQQWLVARVIVDELALYAEDIRPLVRARYVKLAAPLVGKSADTIREWIHTAEVIPVYVECNPRYSMLRFSHFARAARTGDLAQVQIVLDSLVATGQSSRAPSIEKARVMVKALRQTTDPATLIHMTDIDDQPMTVIDLDAMPQFSKPKLRTWEATKERDEHSNNGWRWVILVSGHDGEAAPDGAALEIREVIE